VLRRGSRIGCCDTHFARRSCIPRRFGRGDCCTSGDIG
jgi:hypothetical protein